MSAHLSCKSGLDEGKVMTCPFCGGDFTHLGEIVVWNDISDEYTHQKYRFPNPERCGGFLASVSPDPEESTVDYRGGGVHISRWCEKCRKKWTESIRFHKGTVYFDQVEEKSPLEAICERRKP